MELPEPIALDQAVSEQIEGFYQAAYSSDCNDAMARIHGLERSEDLVGTRLNKRLPRSDPRNVAYLEIFIGAGHRLTGAETHVFDEAGQPKWFLNNLVGIVAK